MEELGPSVVLGELGTILRAGLRVVLTDAGCVLVAHPALADAALLDLDAPAVGERARTLLAAWPGLVVVGCSAERPVLRCFGPAAPPGERALSVGTLLDAVGLAPAWEGTAAARRRACSRAARPAYDREQGEEPG